MIIPSLKMNPLTQKVKLNTSPEIIFEEIIKWSESEWWPDIPMEFLRLSSPGIDNALYLQKAKIPFGPKWHTRVRCVDRDNKYIRRDFLDGMFKGGYEEIYLENIDKSGACAQGQDVDIIYNFCCHLNNPLSKMLWNIIFKKLHTRNINLILNSLKGYLKRQNR